MRIFPICIVVVLLLTSCILAPDGKPQQTKQRKSSLSLKSPLPADFIPRNIRIVSAGDSLTEGVGDSKNQGGYIPYLELLLENEKSIMDVSFSNYGIKGNRSEQLLNRLESAEVRSAIQTADIVIITIGGNDVMKVVRENLTNLTIDDFELEMERYKENLSKLIQTIREVNTDSSIVLVGLYNPFYQWFADLKEMNQIIYDWNLTSQAILANYENTHFVDISDIFLNSTENLLYTDYFHPNDRGYELIAQRVYETMELNVLEATVNMDGSAEEEERHEE